MKKAAEILDRISASLNTIALWGAVVSVILMVFAAIWQAVARYVLSSPPAWTEELARYAMVWCGMLGASCAFRAKTDPTLFPAMLDKKGTSGILWATVRMAGVILFAAPVLYHSLFGPGWNLSRGYIARMITRTSHTLDIPMAWFAIAIPIAFTLIFVHIAAEMAVRLSSGKS
ncbi:MAG: TRAP transporter small permease subunit [bacterium]